MGYPVEKKILNPLEVINSLKNRNIRFNPHPWSNPRHLVSRKIEDSFVEDLHSEVVTKVDALLAEWEKEKQVNEEGFNSAEKDFGPSRIIHSLKDTL